MFFLELEGLVLCGFEKFVQSIQQRCLYVLLFERTV